jgi:hypothetical protein
MVLSVLLKLYLQVYFKNGVKVIELPHTGLFQMGVILCITSVEKTDIQEN